MRVGRKVGDDPEEWEWAEVGGGVRIYDQETGVDMIVTLLKGDGDSPAGNLMIRSRAGLNAQVAATGLNYTDPKDRGDKGFMSSVDGAKFRNVDGIIIDHSEAW